MVLGNILGLISEKKPASPRFILEAIFCRIGPDFVTEKHLSKRYFQIMALALTAKNAVSIHLSTSPRSGSNKPLWS